MPRHTKRTAVGAVSSMDRPPKSTKTTNSSDHPDYRDKLQQLFDGVAENDLAEVEKQLELLPKEALSETLSPGRGGKNRNSVPPRQKAARGRGKAAAASPDPCCTEWMKTACMPWNPSRSFDAASYKCTCLHLAAVLGRPQLCRLLLEKGADPNVKDSASNTALILAAASGSAETVKVIIAAGGLFSKVNDQGVSALHVACKQGSVEVVDVLLQQPGVEINKASSLVDEIPLFCAAYCGHIKVAQLLLEKGADVNKTITSQLTPFHMAARSSNSDMIDLLAKNGANLNSLAWVDKKIRQKLRFDFRDSEFRKGSPLNFAVDSTRDGSLVKVLLSLGADVEAVTQREPCTPLMIAAGKCKTDVARMLLGAGAKTDRPDLEEKALSPLLVALQGYYPGGWESMEAKILECVKLLVEAGASLEAKDFDSELNCMHMAVQCELHEVFAYLLEVGADPWEFDLHDRSAVKYCLQGHHGNPRPWVLKCLQSGLFGLGNMTDFMFGLKPLDYAILNSDLHLLKMYEAAGLVRRECLSENRALDSVEGLEYFESVVNKVLPLKNICRFVISETIGERPGRHVGIEALPVKDLLKRFLMFEDLLPLLQPPPPKFIECMGGMMPVGGDPPVHTMTNRELIQHRGSESEVAQLEPRSDSESIGSGSSYEWPFGSG